LRKFDQVLNIIPDDVDTLAYKAAILQAEGDLPRAAALLAPLRPNADHTSALETQVYQAILERRPAQIISRLKEILAKPDPALGYTMATALLVRLGSRCRWRSCRRPGKLAPSAQRTGIFPQGAAGQFYSPWRSRVDQYGPWRQRAALALSERGIAALPIEKDAASGADSD
jgi:hypothetical protein